MDLHGTLSMTLKAAWKVGGKKMVTTCRSRSSCTTCAGFLRRIRGGCPVTVLRAAADLMDPAHWLPLWRRR